MLVNFIIAGGQKCGTTSVFAVMRKHPDVFVPDIKEVHFFDRDESFNKGKDFYEGFFKKSRGEKAVLDITPNYMYGEKVPERISSMLPNVKIIFLLRDPAKRAYSHYRDHVRRQAEKLPFSEAIRSNPSYIEKSLYFKHLKRFLEYFDRNDIKVYKSEILFKDPKIFYKNFCDFMGVDPDLFTGSDLGEKKNFARMPKVVFFEKIFLTQNRLLGNLRRKIPGILKEKIRYLNEKYNMKEIVSKDLNPNDILFLRKKLEADIDKLKNIFNIDVSDWIITE